MIAARPTSITRSGRLAHLAAATLALAFVAMASATAEPRYSFAMPRPASCRRPSCPPTTPSSSSPTSTSLTLAGIRARRHRGARADRNAGAQRGRHDAQRGPKSTTRHRARSSRSTPATQTATLDLSRGRSRSGAHKLRIGFTAQINKFGRGLFVVDYPTDKARKRMISSHLEPADARRIFPCWDEPAFKATLRAHRHGAAHVPRGQQHAGRRARSRSTPELKQVAFAADAEDVELSLRARRRRARAAHRPTPTASPSAWSPPPASASKAATRSTARSICCATSTTISA